MKLARLTRASMALMLAIVTALSGVPAQALAEGGAGLNADEGIALEGPVDALAEAGDDEVALEEPALDNEFAPDDEVTLEGDEVFAPDEDTALVDEPAGDGAAATDDAPARGGEAKSAKRPSVLYRVHRQTYGWESGWRRNGQSSGTTGQSKRLEGIRIKLTDRPVLGSIQYRTHVQTYGWQGWRSNGAMSGTSGKSKRLEAIQIRLTGSMAKKYDVWYRVHAQRFGWMGWARNGARAGTAGYSYRLEAIQVRLVRKGGPAPGSTRSPFRERKVPAIPTSYIGTYKREVYVNSPTQTYSGPLPAGSLYSTRTLQIKSISGNKVTFKITYVNANMAVADHTGWTTATIKNSKASFDYVADSYGYEYGSGYLKFSGGKVTMNVSTDYYATGMRYTLDTGGPMTLKKGTQRFYN